MIRKQYFGEALVAQGFLDSEQLEKALQIQQDKHRPLGRILLEEGLITESELVRGWSAFLGVPSWDLTVDKPHANVLRLIPQDVCRDFGMVPVQKRQDLLRVAMRNPFDAEAVEIVRNLTGLRVEPVFAIPERIEEFVANMERVVHDESEMGTLVTQAIKEFGRRDPRDPEAVLTNVESRPVIAIVNQILVNAIRLGASDVHVEPAEDELVIRYRVDGELQTVLRFPLDVAPMITARLRILADLDLVEHRIPQDGRIEAEVDGRDVDLRVSILPNENGPRIVLRILERRQSMRKLEDLGLDGQNLAWFRQMIRRPHGLVLVTGPTGSGKTTTLYAALQELSKSTSNILTCEDPVEYKIDGISQTSINEKLGLTFSSALRSILRQDPDVILVGEIRDKDTAETALRASMTGHLVLSTLHCNSALDAVPRLIDLGVDPYLLSSSLVGVTGQRLLRKVCSACATSDSNAECTKCGDSGYRGRRAVHEVLPVSAELAAAISDRVCMKTLGEMAAEVGYAPMVERAWELVRSGVTTESELRRVLVDERFERVEGETVLRAA